MTLRPISIPEAHFISLMCLGNGIKEFIPLVRFLDHFILLFDSRLGQPLGQGKDSKCNGISLPNPRQEVKFL